MRKQAEQAMPRKPVGSAPPGSSSYLYVPALTSPNNGMSCESVGQTNPVLKLLWVMAFITAIETFTVCLNKCSIAVGRHHDHCDSYTNRSI